VEADLKGKEHVKFSGIEPEHHAHPEYKKAEAKFPTKA
jgi:hypothetical protein